MYYSLSCCRVRCAGVSSGRGLAPQLQSAHYRPPPSRANVMEARAREPRAVGKMAPALLHDLAARLSEEDWTLLREWQTELYEVVMKELQQALTSLGPVIASSIFALRPKEKQDFFCAERQDSESQSSCAPSPEGDATTSDDGNTAEQLEEGQHTPELRNQRSTSTEEQPQPTDEADMLEPPSECIQLRHPSSLLQLGIEDGILAKLLIVQPNEEPVSMFGGRRGVYVGKRSMESILGEEKRSRKRKAGDSAVCAEESTACKVMPKKGKAAVLRSAVKETDISRNVSGSMPPQHSKDDNTTSNIQNCNKSKLRNTNLACRPNVQNSGGAHACTVCQKPFARVYHLRRHERVHSGERPYHCTECEKSFTHKHHLTTHQASHGGAKPFHCSQCGKKFSSNRNLNKHRMWQHGQNNSGRRLRPDVRSKL